MLKGGIFFGRDAAPFEQLAHQNNFLFGKILMGVRERHGISVQIYTNSIADLVVHGGSRLLQQMHDLLEVDIGADWMSKQRL